MEENFEALLEMYMNEEEINRVIERRLKDKSSCNQ